MLSSNILNTVTMKKFTLYILTAFSLMGLTTSCNDFGDVNNDPMNLNPAGFRFIGSLFTSPKSLQLVVNPIRLKAVKIYKVNFFIVTVFKMLELNIYIESHISRSRISVQFQTLSITVIISRFRINIICMLQNSPKVTTY